MCGIDPPKKYEERRREGTKRPVRSEKAEGQRRYTERNASPSKDFSHERWHEEAVGGEKARRAKKGAQRAIFWENLFEWEIVSEANFVRIFLWGFFMSSPKCL